MAKRNTEIQADTINLRPPTQARSRESTEALLEIGKRLIAEHGIDGCNMPDVAAAAGSSIGSFYFRFGNKETFVREVMNRHVEETRGLLAKVLKKTSVEAKSPSDVVTAMVAWVVIGARRNQGLLRAQLGRALSDPKEWVPFRLLGQEIVEGMIELLAGYPELQHDPDWQSHVRIAMQLIFGTVNNALINHPGPLELDDSATIPELGRAACRYLGLGELQQARPARLSRSQSARSRQPARKG
jgi:AcrR family transcriptional regulator